MAAEGTVLATSYLEDANEGLIEGTTACVLIGYVYKIADDVLASACRSQ